MNLEPAYTSPSEARLFVRAHLDDLEVPEPPLEDAVLLTSELVTNAVLHARTDIGLHLESDGRRLRIEVHDAGHDEPAPETPALDATQGRGMLIVQALARRWGVDQTVTGKVVWFEMGLG